MPGMFHEKLDAYRLALKHAGLAYTLAAAMRSGAGDLPDQLRRAAASIVLNIAEGAAEFSPAERMRIFRIARRSATECSAIVDVAIEVGVLVEANRATARTMQNRLVAMLTSLSMAKVSKPKPKP